jgi:hypothetical protein
MSWELQKKPSDTPKPPPPPPPKPQPSRDPQPLRESPDRDVGKSYPGIEPSEPWPPPGKKE